VIDRWRLCKDKYSYKYTTPTMPGSSIEMSRNQSNLLVTAFYPDVEYVFQLCVPMSTSLSSPSPSPIPPLSLAPFPPPPLHRPCLPPLPQPASGLPEIPFPGSDWSDTMFLCCHHVCLCVCGFLYVKRRIGVSRANLLLCLEKTTVPPPP
jgi:hypothetical protein